MYLDSVFLGTDLSGGVNNPLYGENTMTGLSGVCYAFIKNKK